MKKTPTAVVVASALLWALGGLTAQAVERAVEAVGASADQLSSYLVDGQVLDGSGIHVADVDTQVDPDHPALLGRINLQTDYSGEGLLDPDTAFHAFRSVNGERVWVNDLHATAVAGVMVSSGLDSEGDQTGHVGISPGITLDVVKYWKSNLEKSEDGAVRGMFDEVANGASILVIEDQNSDTRPDGSSLFSTAVDYLAYAHDTLVVISAGNFGPDNTLFAIPGDAYNGLTVGATDETFGKVASYSNHGPTNDVAGGRAKPDLLAPGTSMLLPFGGWEDDDGRDGSGAVNYKNATIPADVTQFMAPNITAEQDADKDWVTVSGTSFSAPMAAGAAALLQQWGVYRGMDRSDETLRAVMINSANKVNGLIGMTRTIVDLQDSDWLASEAYADQTVPLDDQMGAGQLDVLRALTQYDAGEQGPGVVSNIGWDKHAALTEGEYVDYLIEDPLVAGDYLSATLAWDRQTFFVDNGIVGAYDPGLDVLLGLPLDNLDLYLMRWDDTATEQAVRASISAVDNVEHLFWQVAESGSYKLRVAFTEDTTFIPGFEGVPDFSLAWWAGVPEPGTGALLGALGVGLFVRPRRSA